MFIDSHCHLQNIDHISLEEIMSNCKKLEVLRLLSVCISTKDIEKLKELAQKFDNIDISSGIHPCSGKNEFDKFELISNAATSDKVVAIGETGLDYFKSENKSEQIESFVRHIELSNKLRKPLIIHTRNAAQDTISIMKHHVAKDAVIHCFTENLDTAKKFLDMGYYISFAGIVTFKNALDVKVVAKYVPIDRMLIETDSPYLAPVPHRGKPCEPSFVVHTAKEISIIKNISLSKIAAETSNNYLSLINLD